MAGEWREMPFSHVVTMNPRVQLTRDTTYPFVDMGAVNPDSRSTYASEKRRFDGGGSRFAVGDTLMARITPCLENGKIARFAGQTGEIAHGSTEFIVIRGREGVSDTGYAYYLTKWDGVSGFAISQMTGTSGRQRVPTEAFDHLEVPVPPLTEQRAIAHILGTLDDKIELNRRMNETLEAMARELFKSWFVDFAPVRAKAEGRDPGLPKTLADLFPDSFDDSLLGEVPKGWSVLPIYDLATYVNGAAYKAFNPNDDRRGLPIIKIAELKAGVTSQTKFSEVEMPEKYRLRTGDILFSWSGNPDTSIDTFVWAHGPAWLNQHIFRVEPHSVDERPFVLATLKYLRPVFTEIARNKQTTGLGHVTAGDMQRLLVVKPDARALTAWNREASPLFDAVFYNEQEALTLTRLRDTLLPKLISGELRVKNTNRIAEIV